MKHHNKENFLFLKLFSSLMFTNCKNSLSDSYMMNIGTYHRHGFCSYCQSIYNV